jgi:TolB-like protein
MTILTLGSCAFDTAKLALLRDGREVALGPRARTVLAALAEAGGAVLTKEQLLDRAWPGVTVEEGNLSVQIAALRKALGSEAERIVTIPRVGYRLRIGAVAAPAGLPTLAVRAFELIGEGAEARYFADGITEDIITALGRSRAFVVLSRQAAETPGAVGATYLVTGSIRRAGDRIRVAARLVATATGTQIWARNFDGAAADLFDLQDRITEAIAFAVAPEVEGAEIARAATASAESLDAYDFCLRALPLIYAETEPANTEAARFLARALEIEPDNPLYLVHAAWVLEHRTTAGWDPFGADDRERCIALARRALASGTSDVRVLAHAAISLIDAGHDYDFSLAVLDRALAEQPNSGLVLTSASVGYLHCGPLERARTLAQQALALSPQDPMRHASLCALAHVALIEGEFALAVDEAKRSIAVRRSFDPAHWILVAALALLGRTSEAAEALARLRALSPSATLARIRAGQPSRYPERVEQLINGLALAGLD